VTFDTDTGMVALTAVVGIALLFGLLAVLFPRRPGAPSGAPRREDMDEWWEAVRENGGPISHEDGWTLIATKDLDELFRAKRELAALGGVVVTTDMHGRCLAVTRQDDEGGIQKVIWAREDWRNRTGRTARTSHDQEEAGWPDDRAREVADAVILELAAIPDREEMREIVFRHVRAILAKGTDAMTKLRAAEK
jgi:hypothetical protein